MTEKHTLIKKKTTTLMIYIYQRNVKKNRVKNTKRIVAMLEYI